MIEGLWSVKFMSNNQYYGAGVVVFETGRVFGGDSNFIYLGDYKIKDRVLEINVEVRQYGFANESIFGPVSWGKSFMLELSGNLKGGSVEGKGVVKGHPDKIAAFMFEKQADLP